MAAPASRQRVRLSWSSVLRSSSFWFSVAMVTFGVTTLIAVPQSPRDPYEPLRLDTLSGWLRPSDPGRAKELPAITTDLRAVHVDPKDPQKVWVGGNAGTILYSADGGKTWTKQEIKAGGQ
ncbi:MAG TPA: hypothetical protein VEU30_16370 [Thermoanaerobaculia bacterium]|nr:hypothetical protein [Thermoanaerobaculia bacterium]